MSRPQVGRLRSVWGQILHSMFPKYWFEDYWATPHITNTIHLTRDSRLDLDLFGRVVAAKMEARLTGRVEPEGKPDGP